MTNTGSHHFQPACSFSELAILCTNCFEWMGAPGPLSLCLNIDGTNLVRLHRRSSSKGHAAEAIKVGLIHEASKSVTGVSNL